ncbi:MAG: ribonucleoside triphosphate reductase [bacterium]
MLDNLESSKVLFVVNREGDLVSFDQSRIADAVFKAAKSIGGKNRDISEHVSFHVYQLLLKRHAGVTNPNVEEIQDLVEKTLIELGHAKTAKAYILYREQRRKIRETKSFLLDSVDLIEEYLGRDDWRIKENSNMSFSLQGLHNYVSSKVSALYWLNKIYPNEIRDAHTNGDLHLHDLGHISTYCCGWDLKDLLTRGFMGGYGQVHSKPAKHFRSALGHIVNFFYTLQGESAGAQAFSNFDTYLAPFIRYDNLTYTEVKQAVQEFIFNMNVPTRVGFQTPFTNITMDLQVPSTHRDEPVLWKGELHPTDTYKDFQKEMIILNRAFCEVLTSGDAMGRIFSFPIPTYNITKDFQWDNPEFDFLWEMTKKYGIPYFSNYVNSDMKPEDARSMCCRLRLDNRELIARGGGLFGSNPMTGSIGVVTINLPRIGFLSNNEQEFKDKLLETMELAKQSLEIKREILEKLMNQNLYPVSKIYLESVKEHYDKYWANHFSTIGLVGMNEACLNLFGETIATQNGQRFAKEILTFMRDHIRDYQIKTGHLYNLEATPAEGTSYRLAQLDKKMYPTIVSQGKDVPFYTNSTHLPVNFTTDIFEALKLQDELQTQYTGGTVLHGFIGETIDSSESCKNLVRKISNGFKLPYFTLSPTFSICNQHGYLGGRHDVCPKNSGTCETEVFSRVVGFYRPVRQWNKGKQAEFEIRSTYKMSQI